MYDSRLRLDEPPISNKHYTLQYGGQRTSSTSSEANALKMLDFLVRKFPSSCVVQRIHSFVYT